MSRKRCKRARFWEKISQRSHLPVNQALATLSARDAALMTISENRFFLAAQ